MVAYTSLEGFEQPEDIADRFANFVHTQVQAEPNMRIPSGATIRKIGTLLPGTSANEMHRRAANGYAGIRYIYQDEVNITELHLRTYDTGEISAPTRHYTRYAVANAESGRLLIAHEVNGIEYDENEYEIPGTPQALATAIGVGPFKRGLVTRNSPYPELEPKFWGIVGSEEFASLGKFAIEAAI